MKYKAIKIKDLDWLGPSSETTQEVSLYRMEPNLEGFDYVAVSAIRNVTWGLHETCIFGADMHGKVISWIPLEGSSKDTLSHVVALNKVGYSVNKVGYSVS